ncbi:eukaryotic translation initiation factor 2D [Neodiprion pinetum]|uniref:eukaryotic translation initiation factor 2D n=1 Tax=Neodiprion pinetum TaxID=441929 RepID=UPI001EE12741|nr:eukaryotic translation initiation factor 2D [Neodiprion pinetum]
MFIKAFKVKSNSPLKGSERKKLYSEISATFPSLSDEQIQNILPKKEAVSSIKIMTHSGEIGKLFCASDVPMFFQLDSGIYPTVYTLWQYPDLLHSFTTHHAVIQKLASGADLMLPGVVLEGPPSLHAYGKLEKGFPVSVNTSDNKAAVAVGITAHSSYDLYMAGGRGRCVEILHALGDTLCQLGKPPMRPNLGVPFAQEEVDDDDEIMPEKLQELDIAEEIKTETIKERLTEENTDENREHEESVKSVENEVPSEKLDPIQQMDKLLEYCFLKACKISIKKGDLPMLSSNFFKNHLLAVCPPDQTIDVKKSSYKKLSVFLASMKSKGIINTSTMKGVETLLSVKTDHPLIRELVIMEERAPVEPVVSNVPVVAECYRVTADVFPVLSKFGCDKGDILTRAEVRKCFTEYVKKENLQDGKILTLNPQLAGILRTKEHQETLGWEDALNKFIGRMTHTHQVTVAGTRLVRSGKLEPIDITVATRSGNKKVTLVNNLETFGIKLQEFSKECQGIGASATITDVPGKKMPSVLVQGNQVLYVYKLLTEKYQINKKYIRGLEYAPKQRK